MSSASPANPGNHDGRSVFFYTAIAIFLAIITLIELGPLFGYYNLPSLALIALSVVKFFFVVAFFMHLWDDASIFTRVFAAPLIGAVLMVLVLMLLFSTYNPSPHEDLLPVQERHYKNYSGQCSSWLRSQVSNKLYCASPAIDPDRVATHLREEEALEEVPAPDLTGMSEEEQLAALMERGEPVYRQNCMVCHQEKGQGVPPAFPPLAGSDYLGDPEHHARIIVHGLSGEIVVLGQTYNGVMQSFASLSNFDVAAVATYERNSWGNEAGLVLPEDVAAVR